MSEKKLNGTVIVTYRCNARCSMCNRYKAPSKPDEEISIETIKKLPKMYFTNITGGEPFIRTDLKDIVRELYKKSDRIVISTNGFFTDRIVDLAKEFPQIGIRISIEGLEKTNNEIRGLENGFQRGYGTLRKLREMGMKDVGFGMTVQDKNAPDLVPLYELSNEMGMEFATASLHNSFYFVEAKNIILDPGIGFGKTFSQNVELIARLKGLKKFGFPVLLGVSRKSMFSQIVGDDFSDRDDATAAVGAIAALNNFADILRVHDVKKTLNAVKTALTIKKIWTK